MSTRKNIEPLSEHPLFRALVLMGGGLAVGCGGVAQREAPFGAEIGGSDSASGGAVSNAAGGRASSSAAGGAIMLGMPTAGAPFLSTDGPPFASTAGAANAADVYNPSCPYEQWDCSALAPNACVLTLQSKDDPRAAGCTCDTSRPTSAAACKANESFVCRQGFPPFVETQPGPSTWDGALHLQCACLPTPNLNDYGDCAATCTKAFARATDWPPMRCYLAERTCDETGVCTATSADVLRQDGIMCGCADIGLK